MVLLLIALAIGILFSAQRPVLRTRWPWLGAGIAAAIWAPNVIWQATHGWPQLAMSAALHRENTSPADYAGALPGEIVYLGLVMAPLVVAGFVVLWRTAELRFIAIAATLVVVYVLAWVPGKVYYADGVAPAVLAAGAAATERWIARADRPRGRQRLVVVASLVGVAGDPSAGLAHPAGERGALPPGLGPGQLGRRLHRLATAHAGGRGTGRCPGPGRAGAHFDLHGYYAEAATLTVYGAADHLPPVLSGHNAYWMWGPGRASDRTVLVVDALAGCGRTSPAAAC